MLTGRFETMDPELGKIFDPATLHKYVYSRNNPVNRIDPSGADDAGEVVFIEANTTKNLAYAARQLNVTKKALGCAVHALKAEGGFEGNPDIFIDFTNGNAFLPTSLEFLGCLLDYLP